MFILCLFDTKYGFAVVLCVPKVILQHTNCKKNNAYHDKISSIIVIILLYHPNHYPLGRAMNVK